MVRASLRSVRCAMVAFCALGASGCHVQLRGPWPHGANLAVAEYRIGPGDILRVNVWQNTELSSRVTVRPDGAVTLPLIDEVVVAGKTVPEANRSISESYRRYIAAENHVTVVLEEIHSYRVYVLGHVNHPGEFEPHAPVNVLQALALGGGPTRLADTDHIAILHTEADGRSRRYLFSYDEASGGRLEENFELSSGDTIIVP